MEKKFNVKLTGPGLNLDTPISEAQAKLIFNVAFAPVAVDAPGAGGGAVPALAMTPAVVAPGTVQTPRDFMIQKNPMNEQERLTCIAYYLYKYRKLEKFTAKELKDFNTTAAQPRFNNVSYTARDAANSGYLDAVGGGKKTLSALGERLVEAMPDRAKMEEINKKYGKKNRKRPVSKKAK